MKRTLAMMGLLTLLACDGVQGDEGADQASTAAETGAATTEAEAPRLGAGTALPPGLLARGGLRPKQWGGPSAAPVAPESVEGLRGQFDPGMMDAIQQFRFMSQLKEGAR
jgi:hypothetical protein